MCFKISFLLLLSYVGINILSHIVTLEYFKYHEAADEVPSESAMFYKYHDYLTQFEKTVPDHEFQERLAQFKKTLIAIEKQNRGSNARFGLTKFSDWTERELANMFPHYQGRCEEMSQDSCRNTRIYRGHSTSARILDKLDWREKGVVGSVLDQKLCPVCWAFSVIGVMESMSAIRHNYFTRLSIQEMIDCSFSKRSEKTGCRSGRQLVYAIEYLCKKQMAITSEKEYPLTLTEQECKVHARDKGFRRVVSFKNNCYLNKNETKILELLNRGPVTALVHAQYLVNYVGGIIDVHCETTEDHLNHAVQLVGYDSTGDIPYYILKNSWGADWGERGYARLAARGNQCGVAFTIGSLDVD